jgi:predicted thioesterase
MIDLSTLKPGMAGTAELTVLDRHTAPHVGSGRVPVMATPMLINLMEAAALAAIEDFLPEGHQSLGTRLDIQHVAATPVGMRAEARAVLSGIEGRTLTFELEAWDERETIGGGRHQRVVVDVARFDRRVQAKLEPKGS